VPSPEKWELIQSEKEMDIVEWGGPQSGVKPTRAEWPQLFGQTNLLR